MATWRGGPRRAVAADNASTAVVRVVRPHMSPNPPDSENSRPTKDAGRLCNCDSASTDDGFIGRERT